MKVAEDNVVGLNRGASRYTVAGGMSAPRVYAAHRSVESGEEHDSRGLVVAIALCLACWAALGYFLLS
ncbi:hypothetical protein [Novosphingobium colocasiae]|uniref:hypothetical protein n=1 Tax=Novosphingobium colocasiae TaxID=1256513 RepID=UPI0035AFC25F